jgi:hypothetical protein
MCRVEIQDDIPVPVDDEAVKHRVGMTLPLRATVIHLDLLILKNRL